LTFCVSVFGVQFNYSFACDLCSVVSILTVVSILRVTNVNDIFAPDTNAPKLDERSNVAAFQCLGPGR
jgi:hypothetical protein